MLGRRSAAAADDVHESVHPGDLRSHLRGCLVIAAQFVGKPGVRVTDDGEFAESGDVPDQRQQFIGPQRTVHAEGRERIVPDGRIERLERLPRQRPPAPVAHRNGHDDRESPFVMLGAVEATLHSVERRLHIQRIECRLDQEHIHAPLDEGLHLLPVTVDHPVETVGTLGRTGDVRGQAQRLGRGADAAGHPHLARRPVGRRPGQGGPGPRHLLRPVLQPVFLLGNAVGTERVALDDIGPGRDVGLVHGRDDVRPRQVQALVVPLERDADIPEDTLPEILLREGVPLDLGAHGAIQAEHPVCGE